MQIKLFNIKNENFKPKPNNDCNRVSVFFQLIFRWNEKYCARQWKKKPHRNFPFAWESFQIKCKLVLLGNDLESDGLRVLRMLSGHNWVSVMLSASWTYDKKKTRKKCWGRGSSETQLLSLSLSVAQIIYAIKKWETMKFASVLSLFVENFMGKKIFNEQRWPNYKIQYA